MTDSEKTKNISNELLDISELDPKVSLLRVIGKEGDAKSNGKKTISEERKTFKIEPPSDLLSRVANFLPLLKQENEKLSDSLASNPKELDIEQVDEENGQFIEMALDLGVFDVNGQVGESVTRGVDITDYPETQNGLEPSDTESLPNFLSGEAAINKESLLVLPNSDKKKANVKVIE
ncbi:hypothetical protein AYI69_g10758 [Smittium culicis]|uniref:Uncharacterized protein n=1 Tax=Smittium culicis TaxID=133412 RepID=A0A1R1X3U1_9FUNG|nr:hypothetical protein AYI69_g10758 [Smittium culicis]